MIPFCSYVLNSSSFLGVVVVRQLLDLRTIDSKTDLRMRKLFTKNHFKWALFLPFEYFFPTFILRIFRYFRSSRYSTFCFRSSPGPCSGCRSLGRWDRAGLRHFRPRAKLFVKRYGKFLEENGKSGNYYR